MNIKNVMVNTLISKIELENDEAIDISIGGMQFFIGLRDEGTDNERVYIEVQSDKTGFIGFINFKTKEDFYQQLKDEEQYGDESIYFKTKTDV